MEIEAEITAIGLQAKEPEVASSYREPGERPEMESVSGPCEEPTLLS